MKHFIVKLQALRMDAIELGLYETGVILQTAIEKSGWEQAANMAKAETPSLCRDKPCSECPFTNRSLPGYFGPYEDVYELIIRGQEDNGYPCHTEQDKGCSKLCAGALLFSWNIGKIPRNSFVSNMQKNLKECDAVFESEEGMIEYHEQFLRKGKKK